MTDQALYALRLYAGSNVSQAEFFLHMLGIQTARHNDLLFFGADILVPKVEYSGAVLEKNKTFFVTYYWSHEMFEPTITDFVTHCPEKILRYSSSLKHAHESDQPREQ